MKRLDGIFAVLGWVFTVGCAALFPPQTLPTGVSKQGQIAIYARQVITMADAVLTELDSQTARVLATEAVRSDPARAKLIRSQTVQAATIIGRVGDGGIELSAALRIWYDAVQAGKESGPAGEKVQLALHSLQRNLGLIVVPIDDPTIRAGVQASISQILEVLLNIGTLVGGPAQPIDTKRLGTSLVVLAPVAA